MTTTGDDAPGRPGRPGGRVQAIRCAGCGHVLAVRTVHGVFLFRRQVWYRLRPGGTLDLQCHRGKRVAGRWQDCRVWNTVSA
jgi:hypothetical protein